MLNKLKNTKNHQKIPQSGTLVHLTSSLIDWIDTLESNITNGHKFVKSLYVK